MDLWWNDDVMESLNLPKWLKVTLAEAIEYQEHLNSDSEIVDFLGFVGLRPMEHSNLNIY